MRATTTPEAAAAYSLVTSVSPIVNAVSSPQPSETSSPSKFFFLTGSTVSSTAASYSTSEASSSIGTTSISSTVVPPVTVPSNASRRSTTVQVSSISVGFVVKCVTPI